MATHLRPDRSVFRFSGPDAHRLLNDVVTGHVPTEDGIAACWALLTPQGKILAEGLAGWAEEALWLDVHDSVADDFLKRMKMYRLRAKADIDDLRDTHRVGFAQEVAPGHIEHTDRSGPVDIGWRTITPVDATADWVPHDRFYQSERIAAGIAHLGDDFSPNEIFAHDIALDLLDGIDFAKGCYIGQEVVSRMKHRGTARRRPVIVSGIPDGVTAGSSVSAGGRDAGTVGRIVDGLAVGILRLDRITDPDGAAIGSEPVKLALPVWADYRFGESAPTE